MSIEKIMKLYRIKCKRVVSSIENLVFKYFIMTKKKNFDNKADENILMKMIKAKIT